ncbi:RNA-processing protein, HAT helix [Corchorus olitorius]|uniref:RNA-processing protein, HAT helix n=1 Tax=Corchorus olitorius TaxID=93759 RepID=A0A1R3HXS0_9ROSI|nr:RNA-processing protein, HAT helix [Corchorus olitorius]
MSHRVSVKPKNKAANPIQITAEHIVANARHLSDAAVQRPAKRKLVDIDEVDDYRLKKRKEFEDNISRHRGDTSLWIKYAQWEALQKEFNRARSVWERALELDYKNHKLWLNYAEFEMKNRFINHARNIFDRAITILPRVDQLWLKYIHMEEMVGNIAGSRQIFERWMDWMPDQQAWSSYINFELRYKELDRARCLYERLVECHPRTVSVWIKYAKFEMKNSELDSARRIYERALDKFSLDDRETQKLFLAFAEFEVLCHEIERARCIYEFAIDNLGKAKAEELCSKFVAFEFQYGNGKQIDDAILRKRSLNIQAD